MKPFFVLMLMGIWSGKLENFILFEAPVRPKVRIFSDIQSCMIWLDFENHRSLIVSAVHVCKRGPNQSHRPTWTTSE